MSHRQKVAIYFTKKLYAKPAPPFAGSVSVEMLGDVEGRGDGGRRSSVLPEGKFAWVKGLNPSYQPESTQLIALHLAKAPTCHDRKVQCFEVLGEGHLGNQWALVLFWELSKSFKGIMFYTIFIY